MPSNEGCPSSFPLGSSASKPKLVVLSCSLFILLLSFSLPREVDSIRCYSCFVKPPPKNEEEPSSPNLCSKFNASDWSFVVDCPLSTLCQSRTFKLHTHQQGSTTVTVRGCARQDYSFQIYRKGKGWKTVRKIEEDVYPEGCHLDRAGFGLRRHQTEYCFCKGDLCNDGTKSWPRFKIISFIVIANVILSFF